MNTAVARARQAIVQCCRRIKLTRSSSPVAFNFSIFRFASVVRSMVIRSIGWYIFCVLYCGDFRAKGGRLERGRLNKQNRETKIREKQSQEKYIYVNRFDFISLVRAWGWSNQFRFPGSCSLPSRGIPNDISRETYQTDKTEQHDSSSAAFPA